MRCRSASRRRRTRSASRPTQTCGSRSRLASRSPCTRRSSSSASGSSRARSRSQSRSQVGPNWAQLAEYAVEETWAEVTGEVAAAEAGEGITSVALGTGTEGVVFAAGSAALVVGGIAFIGLTLYEAGKAMEEGKKRAIRLEYCNGYAYMLANLTSEHAKSQGALDERPFVEYLDLNWADTLARAEKAYVNADSQENAPMRNRMRVNDGRAGALQHTMAYIAQRGPETWADVRRKHPGGVRRARDDAPRGVHQTSVPRARGRTAAHRADPVVGSSPWSHWPVDVPARHLRANGGPKRGTSAFGHKHHNSSAQTPRNRNRYPRNVERRIPCAVPKPGGARREPLAGPPCSPRRHRREKCKGPPPDCRRIVIRLPYGIKGRCDRGTTSTGESTWLTYTQISP